MNGVISGQNTALGNTSLPSNVVEQVFTNGDRYIGELQQGKFHGKGIYIFANGNRYVGLFNEGMHEGQGTLYYADGKSKYVGEFHRNMSHGEGTFFYSDGISKYVGTFQNGLQSGRGTLTRADGGEDTGIFRNGVLNGQGTRTFADGSKLEGNFKDGVQDGKVKHFDADGNLIYDGSYKDNMKDGPGVFFYNDGSKYVGYFKNDMRHGRGYYLSDGGKTSELEFVNDEPISNSSHLGDTLFLQLLSQKFASSAPRIYPLGIMSDYLITNGYEETGYALQEAQQTRLFCDTPEKRQAKAEEIYDRLKVPNQPVLLYLDCPEHAMGLQMRQTVDGFVDFEIYNSGNGLNFHQPHPQHPEKFQTVWKMRVPLKYLTPEHIEKFLGPIDDVRTPYLTIFCLPGAKEIVQDEESILWQKPQQANNCTLMWIFAYMKNNMTPQDFTDACTQLHARSLWTAKQSEEPNQELVDSLAKKTDKLLMKTKIFSEALRSSENENPGK